MENLNNKTWDLSKNYDKQLNTDVDAAWVKFKTAKESLSDSKVVKRSFLLPISIAASIAVVVGLFIMTKSNQGPQNLVTANNQIESISLIDGSEIWVNENSSISYFTSKEDKRKVVLDGEAFFKVAPNKGEAFIVESGGAEIKVIGTSFNVREIDGSNAVEVEVKNGKVEVSTGTEKIQLTKGESVIVEAGNLRKKAGSNIGGWRTKAFNFNNQSIAEILDELQREYDVKVVFRNRDLEKCSFTTNFQDTSIDDILEVIATGLGCDLKKVNDTSFVLKGGSCQ